LYTWFAITDSRNVCPDGWHIPTDAEWTALTDTLGGISVAGGKLKSTTNWTTPNTGATNASGFSAFANGQMLVYLKIKIYSVTGGVQQRTQLMHLF
jgi:uncharacterized protein (TIGR02145 family)